MVVTDEEIAKAFDGTDFGGGDHRELLNTSVLKKSVDYHCGFAITCIMKDLKLIGKTGKVTKKGKYLLREAYHDLMCNRG